MKKEIKTSKAPSAVGPYSQGVEAGAIYISGQLPIDPATGKMGTTTTEQTTLSLNNMKAILEEAGLDMNNVVKTTVFMTDLSQFSEMNGVYETYFESPFPSRSTIQVAGLPLGASVEIECIAKR